jgi:guanylate kinase
MRRPWNQEATGMLAVNHYDEFLKLVEVIAQSHSTIRPEKTAKDTDVVVLVGPSCSGKSKIATRFLSKHPDFEKLTSYTTKDPTAYAENKWYTYVSLDEFRRMNDSDELLTSTMYAGHAYGSKRCDIDDIIAGGKRVLTTMDICGAMSLKTYYKNVTTIYMKREKKALMASILKRNSSIEDKVNRLSSIDYEEQNAALCDHIIHFDDYDEAVAQLDSILAKHK